VVLITDATIATGAAALMAIRVILDHDVPEVSLLCYASLIYTLMRKNVGKHHFLESDCHSAGGPFNF
jgi:uracil phosphoribosyltransferase